MSSFLTKCDRATLGSPGYVATGRDEGATDLVDSDANRTTGRTIQTQLTSNEDDPNWDAGSYIAVDLGDYVWFAPTSTVCSTQPTPIPPPQPSRASTVSP